MSILRRPDDPPMQPLLPLDIQLMRNNREFIRYAFQRTSGDLLDQRVSDALKWWDQAILEATFIETNACPGCIKIQKELLACKTDSMNSEPLNAEARSKKLVLSQSLREHQDNECQQIVRTKHWLWSGIAEQKQPSEPQPMKPEVMTQSVMLPAPTYMLVTAGPLTVRKTIIVDPLWHTLTRGCFVIIQGVDGSHPFKVGKVTQLSTERFSIHRHGDERDPSTFTGIFKDPLFLENRSPFIEEFEVSKAVVFRSNLSLNRTGSVKISVWKLIYSDWRNKWIPSAASK